MFAGYTSLYYNISDRSLLYFIVSIPLVFLFNECAGYYSHRMFHIPVLYKTIHKWHHRYHQPTPLAATAMHPLEFLTYQTYYAAPAFIFPVHVGKCIILEPCIDTMAPPLSTTNTGLNHNNASTRIPDLPRLLCCTLVYFCGS